MGKRWLNALPTPHTSNTTNVRRAPAQRRPPSAADQYPFIFSLSRKEPSNNELIRALRNKLYRLLIIAAKNYTKQACQSQALAVDLRKQVDRVFIPVPNYFMDTVLSCSSCRAIAQHLRLGFANSTPESLLTTAYKGGRQRGQVTFRSRHLRISLADDWRPVLEFNFEESPPSIAAPAMMSDIQILFGEKPVSCSCIHQHYPGRSLIQILRRSAYKAHHVLAAVRQQLDARRDIYALIHNPRITEITRIYWSSPAFEAMSPAALLPLDPAQAPDDCGEPTDPLNNWALVDRFLNGGDERLYNITLLVNWGGEAVARKLMQEITPCGAIDFYTKSYHLSSFELSKATLQHGLRSLLASRFDVIGAASQTDIIVRLLAAKYGSLPIIFESPACGRSIVFLLAFADHYSARATALLLLLRDNIAVLGSCPVLVIDRTAGMRIAAYSRSWLSAVRSIYNEHTWNTMLKELPTITLQFFQRRNDNSILRRARGHCIPL